MSLFTLILVLLIVLNLGVLLGFWIFSTLRDDADDGEAVGYVGSRPHPNELLSESSF